MCWKTALSFFKNKTKQKIPGDGLGLSSAVEVLAVPVRGPECDSQNSCENWAWHIEWASVFPVYLLGDGRHTGELEARGPASLTYSLKKSRKRPCLKVEGEDPRLSSDLSISTWTCTRTPLPPKVLVTLAWPCPWERASVPGACVSGACCLP